MRSLRVASVATLLTLSALLTGCGGDDDKDSKSDDEVTETVTASPSETTTTDATETPTDATPMDPTDGDITQEQVEAALLTPEEVGPDFTLGEYTEEDSPPLCDPEGATVDEQVPPQVQAGTQLDHVDGNIAMQEQIVIYATEAEAAEAFGLATAGLACTEGTSEGSPITIGAAQDVTAQVNSTSGLGVSTAWEVSGEGFDGVLVATLAGRIILATQFASAPDVDTSGLPNPVDIATAAFAKALAS